MRCSVSFPSIHRVGGIERVGLELANQIAAAGHESIVTAYDVDRQWLDPRVQIRQVPRPRGPALWQSLRFSRLAEQALTLKNQPQPDISFGLGALAPRGSVVWVTSVHARWLDVASRPPFKGSIKRRLNPFHPVMLRQERLQFSNTYHAHLMGMAQNVVQDLQTFYKVDSTHISEIPHGYDTNQFNLKRGEELRQTARQRWGIASEDRVVLCVANELHRKGVPQLMQAVAKVQSSQPRLLVAGRMAEGLLKDVAAQANLAPDRLIVAGMVQDVAEAVAACDVMVLPTFYDSWGLVIIESLACGRPVVATRLAGASQVVQPGVNGQLIDHPEQIDDLACMIGQVLDSEMAPQACADSVAHLAWPHVIGRVLACGQKATKAYRESDSSFGLESSHEGS